MKKIQMRSLFLVMQFVSIFAGLSGCTEGSSSPPFGGTEASVPPDVSLPPSVDENLAEQAGVQRIIYHVGPVDLPARTDVQVMGERPLSMRFQTERELWVTGFVPKVVNANGDELPAELLHQATVFNMHEENPLCAGSPNPFFIASSMLTELNLPRGYGYPVLPTDPIEARVVLKNPTETNYIDVFFEFTLVARAMNEIANLKDVKPVLLEPSPCDHAAMEAPPHEFKNQNATYQVPMKSALVSANGILQDFGAAVELTKGTDAMPFWRAESVLDENHHVTALAGNPFEDEDGVGLSSTDRITIGVSYDNTSDVWLKEATAAVMLYLAPKD